MAATAAERVPGRSSNERRVLEQRSGMQRVASAARQKEQAAPAAWAGSARCPAQKPLSRIFILDENGGKRNGIVQHDSSSVYKAKLTAFDSSFEQLEQN